MYIIHGQFGQCFHTLETLHFFGDMKVSLGQSFGRFIKLYAMISLTVRLWARGRVRVALITRYETGSEFFMQINQASKMKRPSLNYFDLFFQLRIESYFTFYVTVHVWILNGILYSASTKLFCHERLESDYFLKTV